MLEKFYIACTEENHWTLTDATRADDKIIADRKKRYEEKKLRREKNKKVSA